MKYSLWIALAVAAALGLLGSVYVVREGQVALVLNLGRVARTDIGPGLHFKLPLVETVRTFDSRFALIDFSPERYLTSERKDVSVDFVAIGYIHDATAFYRATGGDETRGTELLAPIVKDSLRNEINARTLTQLVSGNRGELIEKQLPGINAGAKTLGVSVVDIRFKQIELRRCRTLHLEFDEAPPAQMDGELIEGTSFDIAVEPAALNVLVPF